MARVLLTDDDTSMRTTLAEVLRLEGHDVDTAEDGQAAIECFETFHHDLVVLDHRMPGMSGEEVMYMLRSVDTGARIVMMSAFATEAERDVALTRGALAFFDKPLELDDFLALVAHPERPGALVLAEHAVQLPGGASLRDHYRVSQHTSANAAMHLARQVRFDIAIIDGDLAPASSIEICGTLQRVNPRCQVILLAGDAAAPRTASVVRGAAADFHVVYKSQVHAQLPRLLAAIRAGGDSREALDARTNS